MINCLRMPKGSGEALVEEILSDDDTCPHQCTSNNTLWITFNRHILQMTDKAELESGELSDQHIQLAQSIIKEQFPLLGVFETLYYRSKMLLVVLSIQFR